MKPRRKPSPPTLTDFAKQTKKGRGGQRSPLDDHATAAADVLAFAEMKASGTTTASWLQFATWLQKAHGISMRGNSLYQWARNRSR